VVLVFMMTVQILENIVQMAFAWNKLALLAQQIVQELFSVRVYYVQLVTSMITNVRLSTLAKLIQRAGLMSAP
jgi:hypothetical protein